MSGPRKVPDWVFLSQLFNEVILKDRVALSASSFSSRVSVLRRIVLASVIGLALIFAIGFLTSFLGNFSPRAQPQTGGRRRPHPPCDSRPDS